MLGTLNLMKQGMREISRSPVLYFRKEKCNENLSDCY